MDIFERLQNNRGPLGQYSQVGQGYFFFPKLEGEISNRMTFRGKDMLVWSVNNYLGLANHPEVRETDANAAAEYGLSLPMGARIMSGNSSYHEQLESELSAFVGKEDTVLLNYGYQGCASAIDALLDRNDVAVYDSESHACIIDGVRMHHGKRFVFKHNDIDSLKVQLERATRMVEKTNGGILVITEGVFGMAGDQGLIKEIVELKKQYNFRLFVDDAHGIGTMGATGAGTGEAQGVQDGIDVYFGTFAKSFATIGAFISSEENVIEYLRYNTRSQVFAKSLPMPLVVGALKRLEMIRDQPEHRNNLWKVVDALQSGLRANGFNLGRTNSPVTPVFLEGGPYEAAN
ncbi:MAG: aminotransferase class I/II-fold pyridoxal phosphate-dependent enzyme, partial [Salibacteraceae bacterium]